MASSTRDRITGAVLLAVAVVWLGLVYTTIDPGQAPAGPRTFPLIFGYALAVLSLLMLAQTFFASPAEDDTAADGIPNELFAVVTTICALVLYGFLLEPLGFVAATAFVVALMMIFILRIYSPLKVLAMSIGLALGSFIVFGKLLGTFLPAGRYFPIYF